MAKIKTELTEYVGISNTTITNGLTPVIEVVIPEFIPTTDGLPGDTEELKSNLTDPFTSKKEESKVKKVKTVVCTYLGCGDNNQLIPCVHKGERIRVFNYGGSEQYYWKAFGKDPGIRLHERCRWFAMDVPTSVLAGSYENVKDTNTYFVEINTNPGEKEFHIHTSISDSEPWTYDIRIMPERGILEITDNAGPGLGDTGNCIRLNTKEHWWHLRNIDNSTIDVNKENITLKCNDTITLDAGNNIIMKAGNNISSTAGNNISSDAGSNISEKAGANISNDAGANLSATAAAALSAKGADVTISGSSSCNITGSSGDAVINSISLVKHTHPVPPHCPSEGMTLLPI